MAGIQDIKAMETLLKDLEKEQREIDKKLDAVQTERDVLNNSNSPEDARIEIEARYNETRNAREELVKKIAKLSREVAIIKSSPEYRATLPASAAPVESPTIDLTKPVVTEPAANVPTESSGSSVYDTGSETSRVAATKSAAMQTPSNFVVPPRSKKFHSILHGLLIQFSIFHSHLDQKNLCNIPMWT